MNLSPMDIAEVSPTDIAEIGNAWEGRILDARLPLRQWLGISDHSCVYLTEVAGPKSPKAVVKIFPADFFDFEHQVARWRTVAQLHCPSLLRLLDGGRSEIDGTPFFFVVTDFAEENLSQVLPQRALTADEVKALLPPVLEGLTYLHKNGFVHGHIQPSNIMAAGDKLKLPVERIYAVGEARDRGTISPYDAPEIATGALTPAADVWSLGMFLAAALKQHPLPLRGQLAPLIPTDIPEPVRSIIGDCLTVDPKNRCTLDEIAAWLEPVPAPAKSAPAPISAPLRIVEVSDKPIGKPAVQPSGSAPAAWRIGAPIAAIALIVTLFVGQKIVSHRHDLAVAAAKPTAADAFPPEGAVLHQVVPNVPANKRRTIKGQIQVSVQVAVDPSGKVTAAKLVSPGPSQYLADLAVQTAQQWQFSPAQNNGSPVPSAWQIRFQFGRRTTQVFPARVTQP
jgi:TonB family protein